jgi:patatin-related protein
MRRWVGNVFVERRLLYVEPSPEHPELAPPPPVDRRPDFAENVRAAVMDLPRHETIREDLAQIDERNETIRRANKLTETVDLDVEAYRKQRRELIERYGKTDVAADLKKYLAADALPTNEFREAGLSQMIAIYGIGYGGYHRLRVEETTQLLSDIVTRIAGYDPASDAADVIREIAEQWRRLNYTDEKGTGIAKMENEFLYEFDLAYRLRRLAFLSRRVNDLGQLNDEGKLHPTAIDLLYRSAPKSIGEAQITSPDWVKTFREELQQLKKILGLATIEARVAAEQLFHPTVDIEKDLPHAQKDLVNAAKENGAVLSDDRITSLGGDRALYFSYRLFALVSKLGLRWQAEDKEGLVLSNLLEKSATDRIFLIRDLLRRDQRPLATLQQLADTIRAAFRDPNSAELRVRLQQNDVQLPPNDARKVARDSLLYYYDNFTFYDLVTYPIQYGTSVGEANIVEVFRVSPHDATALIDEQAVGEQRRKLAGTALMSFGAFIDPAWRKNDMLWGRLDGAERIITALLPRPPAGEEDPYEKVRKNLIREAHIAIFKEEVHQTDLVTLQGLLSNMLGRIEPTTAQAQKLREVVQAATVADKKTLPVAFESALRQCFKDPSQVRDYYKKQFEVNRRFDPENALRLISRATNITGRMLEGLANKIGSDPAKRASAWIARFGSVFWGMVAVAVPSSLGNLLARHWLGLLYVLSFITLVLSIWVPWMAPTGWSALGISVGLNLLLFVLGDIIRGRRFWLRALTILLVVVFAALIAGGVLFALEQLNAALTDNDKKQFMTTAGRLVAGAVAGLILIAFVAREWHKGLQQYLAAPHSSFDQRRLKWVIGVTLGLVVLLYRIGPPDIVKLEFAGTPEAASTFLQNTDAATVRLQLGVDYLFIIAYTVMMASFCIVAAKLFWNEFKRWEGWHYLVAFGFFLAAVQCIAGMCDAAENTGLLWFLSKGAAVGLTVSLYCATVKFVLVAVGALYATVGFIIGTCTNKGSRLLLIACAMLSTLALIFAVMALRFHPGLGALLHPSW